MTAVAVETAAGLETAWQQLAAEPAVVGGAVTHLLRDLGHGRSIRIGLNGHSRLLIIPCSDTIDVSALQCAGLTPTSRRYRSDGGQLQVVEIACVERRNWSVFNRFVLDFASIMGLERIDDLIAPLARIIADYRAFLSRPHGMGIPEVTGLFGELWVLDLLTSRRRDVVTMWEGPQGGVHDFRNATQAIEVKTTLSRGARVVTINGLLQLVPPPNGRLHLAFLQVETREQGAGITIPQLVQRIRTACSNAVVLDQRLELANWDEGASELHGQRVFEVRSFEMADVDSSFPAITPGVLAGHAASGMIARLEYDVAVPPQSIRTVDPVLEAFIREAS